MPKDISEAERLVLSILYRTFIQLLTTRRMQAFTWTSTITVYELIFVDDHAFNSAIEVAMQRSLRYAKLEPNK
ncbi:unnamed protein product [Dibothriocephalus latus]|uniref:Uncharacterized protein n=1 Tax=Dibothriocephalus latus TaxID=60516 RepID=A0A3P7Q997_DIBLA|nr:unnamed protein product [Dibothriocephalus latus]